MLLGLEGLDIVSNILKTRLKWNLPRRKKFDVAIITALEHIESVAVNKLPLQWEAIEIANDCTLYRAATFTDKNGSLRHIVATTLPRMGIAAAAAITMKVCQLFQPEYVIMTGISAGIKGNAEIGDILVADPCWDWGSGKLTVKDGAAVFLSAPHQVALDPIIQAKISNISASRTYLDDIYCKWTETRPAHDLNVHVGPVSSGAVVLEDPETVELIKSQHRKTLGVEMEAYGVAVAATIAGGASSKPIIIKSVCDFADPLKNNEWQKYAAYTSAEFALRLIQNELNFDGK